MNKEALIGILTVALAIAVVGFVGGLQGLIYVGLTLVVAMLALFLFTRSSTASKVGAVVLFPEILTKLLMPKSTKQAIRDLEIKELEIPKAIIERDGPFNEFKQDGAIVSVELTDGRQVSGVLLIYPNYVGAIENETTLTFKPSEVVKVWQSSEDLTIRTKGWTFFYDPAELSK